MWQWRNYVIFRFYDRKIGICTDHTRTQKIQDTPPPPPTSSTHTHEMPPSSFCSEDVPHKVRHPSTFALSRPSTSFDSHASSPDAETALLRHCTPQGSTPKCIYSKPSRDKVRQQVRLLHADTS